MSGDDVLREQLLELVDKIRAARDHLESDDELLAEFHRLLPATDVDNLCDSDYADETIVDICLGEKDTRRKLNREEMIQLVRDIMGPATETEAEKILMVLAFNNNCRRPAGSDLIFYPADSFGGRLDPTPEEIVDKALSGE